MEGWKCRDGVHQGAGEYKSVAESLEKKLLKVSPGERELCGILKYNWELANPMSICCSTRFEHHYFTRRMRLRATSCSSGSCND